MKPERPEPEEHWQNRQAHELHTMNKEALRIHLKAILERTPKENHIDNLVAFISVNFPVSVNLPVSNQLAISALERIANPLVHLQNEAEKEGTKLDGMMAMQIIQQAQFYREIAKSALAEITQDNVL